MSSTAAAHNLSQPGLSILSPGVRKFVFSAIDLAFFGLLVLFSYLLLSRQAASTSVQPATAARRTVTTLSRPQVASARELIVSDLQVTPDYEDFDWYRYRPSGYQLTARVRNTSTLSGGPIRGELVAFDCQTARNCAITGRQRLDIPISIPPGASAQLQAHLWSNAIMPASYSRKWRIDLDQPSAD
jgi:hypothetical protein